MMAHENLMTHEIYFLLIVPIFVAMKSYFVFSQFSFYPYELKFMGKSWYLHESVHNVCDSNNLTNLSC